MDNCGRTILYDPRGTFTGLYRPDGAPIFRQKQPIGFDLGRRSPRS